MLNANMSLLYNVKQSLSQHKGRKKVTMGDLGDSGKLTSSH